MSGWTIVGLVALVPVGLSALLVLTAVIESRLLAPDERIQPDDDAAGLDGVERPPDPASTFCGDERRLSP